MINNNELEYELRDLAITPDPNDRRAQVVRYPVANEAMIVDFMCSPGSTVTKAEALANFEQVKGAYEYFLKMGYGIKTSLIDVRPTITGVFIDKNDRFDPSRHQINFRVKLGKRYADAQRNVKTKFVKSAEALPEVDEFWDGTTNTTNELATPGKICKISGNRLKLDLADMEQGIFFISKDGSKTVRVSIIAECKNSSLVFETPSELPSGEYTVEVRTYINSGKDLKKGRLADMLTI